MSDRHIHSIPAVLVLILSMLVSMSLATPLAAQVLPTTHPGPHAAQVKGAPGRITQDIYPVRIVEINGRNIQPRDVIWLEPGRYEMRVQVEIPNGPSTRRHPGDTLRWRNADAETRREALTIELDLEAGKTYEIRARYNRRETEGFAWSTVLWRVEE